MTRTRAGKCRMSVETAGQQAAEPAEALSNRGRATRSLLRSQPAGLFYAFAPRLLLTQSGKRAPDLCTLHAAWSATWRSPRALRRIHDGSAIRSRIVRPT